MGLFSFGMKSIAFYTLPIVLGYLTVIAVNETERFTTDASAGSIHKDNPVPYGSAIWACHKNRRHCFDKHLYGLPMWLKNILRGPLDWMMDELGAKKTGNELYYRLANLLLLGILWPLLLSIMIMHIREKGSTGAAGSAHNDSHLRSLALPRLLSVYILQTNGTSNSVKCLYDYLTEFILTLSHWSGVTYYDVNALLFIIMMPLLSVVLPGVLAISETSKAVFTSLA